MVDEIKFSTFSVSFRGAEGTDAPLGTFSPCLEPFPPAWNLFEPLEIVLLILIIDVDKCLTKCMSSESMHMQ